MSNKKTNKLDSKYAYVTMVIKGDRYVDGAVALAKSILISGSPHDIICMVDDSVSEKGIKNLKENFTHVILVDRIYKETSWGGQKSHNRYSSWWKFSFTKWRCLTFTQYKKILFVDADVIVIQNMDDLFNMKAPGGVFMTKYFAHHLNKHGHGPFDKKMGFPKHGNNMNMEKLLTADDGILVMAGGLMLLTPSCERFCRLLNILCSVETFTVENALSGSDTLSIAMTFRDCKWTNFNNIYHYRAGSSEHPAQKSKRDQVKAIHYLNEKPWEIPNNNKRRSLYFDVQLWWDIFNSPVTSQRKISSEELKKLQAKVKKDYQTVYNKSYQRNFSKLL